MVCIFSAATATSCCAFTVYDSTKYTISVKRNMCSFIMIIDATRVFVGRLPHTKPGSVRLRTAQPFTLVQSHVCQNSTEIQPCSTSALHALEVLSLLFY